MKNIFNRYKKYIYRKGFTLAELIIVIAIIAIISAITLFNNAKLNSSILLANTAYEISLIIRDAQVSGLGSKVFNNGVMATTSNQGVYVNINEPNKIVFFADKNKDDRYTVSALEENQIYNIENKRAGKILKICKISGSNCQEISELNILFKRPNPESYFWYTDGGSLTSHNGSVVINVGFEDGDCRSILIYKTGAIQIDKNFCPQIITP